MSLISKIKAVKTRIKYNNALMNFAQDKWRAGEDQDVLSIDGVEYMKLEEIDNYSYWIEFTKKENWNFDNYLVMKEDGEELVSITDECELERALAYLNARIMKYYKK